MTECPKCWMPMGELSSMCINCMLDEEEITFESNREWFKLKWLVANFDQEDFETFFKNYPDNWFTEFKRFYDYCNVNKEYIWCKQELTEKQWDILVWNMAFVHSDLTTRICN